MCGCGEGACWATVLAVSAATASCKKNLERMCTGQARSKMRQRGTDARLQQQRGCSRGAVAAAGGGAADSSAPRRRTAGSAPGLLGARMRRSQGVAPSALSCAGRIPTGKSTRADSALRRRRWPAGGRRSSSWLRAARTLAGAHMRVCVIDANFWNKPRTEHWVRGRARGRRVVRSCGKADSSVRVAREAGGSPKMSVCWKR